MSSRSTFRKNLLHPPKKIKSYRISVSNSMLLRPENISNAIRRQAKYNRTMKQSMQGPFYMGNMLSALEETPNVEFKIPPKLNLLIRKLKLSKKRQTKKQQKKKPVKK